MARDIKSVGDWMREFERIREGVAGIRSASGKLREWIWNHVVAKDVYPQRMPPEVSESLGEIDDGLRVVGETSDGLSWYFSGNPAAKWLAGRKLTREEYYLLAAWGGMVVPSETGTRDAYEEYSLYYYEDDERRGYIDPDEHHDSPEETSEEAGSGIIRVKAGIAPEEVKKSFLGTEQSNFFREFRPDIFARFRKD